MPSIQVSIASGRLRIPWPHTKSSDVNHPAALAQMSTDTLSQLLKMLTSVLGTFENTQNTRRVLRSSKHRETVGISAVRRHALDLNDYLYSLRQVRSGHETRAGNINVAKLRARNENDGNLGVKASEQDVKLATV